jgi:cell wall-associated NlpC family hydrolase
MNRAFRTGASLLATTALAATAIAATAAPAQSAPATKTAAVDCGRQLQSYSTVRAGSKGRAAAAAECYLAQAGYSVSKNGAFSADDAKAAAKFNASRHISGGAVIGKASWTSMVSGNSHPSLKKGARGYAVLRAQRALSASGRSVPRTGTFDTATANAIKGLQRAKGWKQSGYLDQRVWGLLRSGQAASVRVMKPSSVSASYSSLGLKALAFAKRQLGDPYRFGAAGPGSWDCSGLTMKAWAAAGKHLPHSARGQFHKGKAVSKKNLRPGDLVFFYSGISHVAIYAGHGKVIHAPQPGKRVSYISMKYMPYEGARRIG